MFSAEGGTLFFLFITHPHHILESVSDYVFRGFSLLFFRPLFSSHSNLVSPLGASFADSLTTISLLLSCGGGDVCDSGGDFVGMGYCSARAGAAFGHRCHYRSEDLP